MKTAIDNNGAKVLVPLDTPVKTVDGVHYLLNAADSAEIKAKEDKWAAGSAKRAEAKVIAARLAEYGTAEAQIEYAVEHGWDALVARNKAIKEKHPK